MTTTEQHAFIGVLAEAIGTDVPDAFDQYRETVRVANQFMKLARTLERINVRECNGYHIEAQRLTDEQGRARTEARLKDLCRHYGFGLNLGGDPRGYAVKLILPTGRYNTFGGKEEGYGVPT